MQSKSSPSSRPRIRLLALVALWLLIGGTARAERRLSLDEAVQLALKQNAELKLEQAKVDAAEATRKSTRGLYGPKVMVEGNRRSPWGEGETRDRGQRRRSDRVIPVICTAPSFRPSYSLCLFRRKRFIFRSVRAPMNTG